MDGEKNEFKIGIFISKSGSFNFFFSSSFFFVLVLFKSCWISLEQFLPSFIGRYAILYTYSRPIWIMNMKFLGLLNIFEWFFVFHFMRMKIYGVGVWRKISAKLIRDFFMNCLKLSHRKFLLDFVSMGCDTVFIFTSISGVTFIQSLVELSMTFYLGTNSQNICFPFSWISS